MRLLSILSAVSVTSAVVIERQSAGSLIKTCLVVKTAENCLVNPPGRNLENTCPDFDSGNPRGNEFCCAIGYVCRQWPGVSPSPAI